MKIERKYIQKLTIRDVPDHIFWFLVKYCDVQLSATAASDREIMIHRWRNTHDQILYLKRYLSNLKDQEYVVDLFVETIRDMHPVHELRIFAVTSDADWVRAKHTESFEEFKNES